MHNVNYICCAIWQLCTIS